MTPRKPRGVDSDTETSDAASDDGGRASESPNRWAGRGTSGRSKQVESRIDSDEPDGTAESFGEANADEPPATHKPDAEMDADPWELEADDETALEETQPAAAESLLVGAFDRLENIRRERTAAEDAAEREHRGRYSHYAAIMRRIDAPQPGDREQLAELVVQLGFDRARIEADAIVIRRVRSWEQKVSEIPELERKEKEIGRKTTALKKQHEALRQEGRKATALIASRRQLERELIKLRCDHAPLLAEEPVSEGEFCVADAAR